MKNFDLDKIKVGNEIKIEKTFYDKDIKIFSELSGDTNPIHLDENYAKNSRYKKKLTHGFLASSLFSGIFGTKTPGPGCVYKSQYLKFIRPIFIGDKIEAKVKVTEFDKEKKIVKFETTCTTNNKVSISGNAEIFLPNF